MITWLASYPRSGSALLRNILKTCFGLKSYDSMHGALSKEVLSPAACERIGLRYITTTWTDFYQEARRSDDNIIIKTHKPPIDEEPAIYIIRAAGHAVTATCAIMRASSPRLVAAFCKSFRVMIFMGIGPHTSEAGIREAYPCCC